jgi:tetratricopeptide (TPR) repeat protein
VLSRGKRGKYQHVRGVRTGKRRLTRNKITVRRIAIGLLAILTSQSLFAWPQDIAGGAGALVGQDIIGGASVTFKRPPRVRDLAGGAAALIVKHRPPRRPTPTVEIARNRPPVTAPSPGQVPQPEPTPAEISTEAKVDSFNDEGNKAYDAGDYAKALTSYNQALALDANDVQTLNNVGVTYLALNQTQNAIDSFQKATKAKADDADGFFNLGVAYNSSEKYDEAATALNRALALRPDWPDAFLALGDTYLAAGRFDDASKAYENVVKAQPDNVSAFNNLAYAYDRAGRYEDSIRALKRVVQLSPSDAFGFNNLGAASYKAGKYKDAVDAFTQALRLSPNDPETLNMRKKSTATRRKLFNKPPKPNPISPMPNTILVTPT